MKRIKEKKLNPLKLFITVSIILGIFMTIYSFTILYKKEKPFSINNIIYKNDGLQAFNQKLNITLENDIYEYRYIGNNPKNYYKLDDKLYRIISIQKNNNKLNIRLIEETSDKITLDNIDIENSNILNYLKGDNPTNNYFGKINLKSNKLLLKTMEATKMLQTTYSLLNPSDILMSTEQIYQDSNLENNDLIKNSWLKNYNTILSDTRYYLENDKIIETIMNNEYEIRKIININVSTLNGSGTINNPYY